LPQKEVSFTVRTLEISQFAAEFYQSLAGALYVTLLIMIVRLDVIGWINRF
jgi:hypothetical protein